MTHSIWKSENEWKKIIFDLKVSIMHHFEQIYREFEKKFWFYCGKVEWSRWFFDVGAKALSRMIFLMCAKFVRGYPALPMEFKILVGKFFSLDFSCGKFGKMSFQYQKFPFRDQREYRICHWGRKFSVFPIFSKFSDFFKLT